MLYHKVPITSVELISERLKVNEDIDMPDVKLKQFIKHELGMKYRISKKLPSHANS